MITTTTTSTSSNCGEDASCGQTTTSRGGVEQEDTSLTHQTSTRDNGTTRSPEEINATTLKAKLSKKETEAVRRLRFIFILIKLAVAGIVAYVMYRITKNSEQQEFQHQYNGVANQLSDSFVAMGQRVSSISSVGTAATIYGIDQPHARWPFLTLTHFQQRTASARLLSNSLYMGLQPVVSESDREAWEKYAVGPARYWIKDALDYQTKLGYDQFIQQNESSFPNRSKIFYVNQTTGETVIDSGPGPYLIRWLTSPLVDSRQPNENLFRDPDIKYYGEECTEQGEAVFRDIEYGPPGNSNSSDPVTSFYATLLSMQEENQTIYDGSPVTRLYLPVFDKLDEANGTVVAVLASWIHWQSYFSNLLPSNVDGIYVVLENVCQNGADNFTYIINGAEATPIGFGDQHDTAYDQYGRTASFAGTRNVESNQSSVNEGSDEKIIYGYHRGCVYYISIYPSDAFYSHYHTSTPAVLTASMMLVILFTIFMFVLYDRLVEKRQRVVLTKAAQSTAIVSSMFPEAVRDKLMEREEEKVINSNDKLRNFFKANNHVMKDGTSLVDNQIADLYTHCTVMFADICGFTAWSSTREPQNVFVLLQTLYNAFDNIAKRRKVFKVETIGDCYMAVTGIPVAQPTHAVIMARFAWECRARMHQVMVELEKRLGPDCAELAMRFGLHSGPVTAGVLVGDRARFQLFGDTVNTASRMESTGIRDKVQISQETANLLTADGKTHWIKARETTVEAKGKGTMQTYWLHISSKKTSSITSNDVMEERPDSSHAPSVATAPSFCDIASSKLDRHVDWLVELLLERLRPMLIHRYHKNEIDLRKPFNVDMDHVNYEPPPGTICFDEVKEVIDVEPMSEDPIPTESLLPDFDHASHDLIRALEEDLHSYVHLIAGLYRNENPFHNFEHACHVTMSVNKLLKRMATCDSENPSHKLHHSVVISATEVGRDHDATSYIHNLCCDSLALFAIVFSALIHDVDHRGCSNTQLAEEDPSLGTRYRRKSIAEQNSLDVAWNLLMDDRFRRLRLLAFHNSNNLLRFRQFVVNSVMATDIFDAEINGLRQNRWYKAFPTELTNQEPNDDDMDSINRKTLIVVEHIMQASDVSHTMQHWQVFMKWNKMLFREMYVAYTAGRLPANPQDFWYEGELHFFDHYVIPLANKLKECRVFGVSSDEYYNYAVSNRNEWAATGQDKVVEMMLEINEHLSLEDATEISQTSSE